MNHTEHYQHHQHHHNHHAHHTHHATDASEHTAAVHDHNKLDEHTSHDKHAGHHTHDFLRRFYICLVVTIPVLLLSPMIRYWIGFGLEFPGDKYVLLTLSSFIYFYGGMPFLKGLVSEIRNNAIGMMTLVAVAITAAYIYSVAVVFGLKGMDFFWELATLIDIMLLGHWLEMRSAMAATNALQSLVALLPSKVHIERDGQMIDIDISKLMRGDLAIIKPGEKIPADGIVVTGKSFVNESMLTGESIPVKKELNDKVIAGGINGDGSLKIRVTGAGQESYLNKVITLVRSAQAAKSKTQNLADKVAKWLTFISLVAGVITFIVWYANHDLAFALERMVTVMVTACPHALGVAIPLVVAISTTASATHGLLIRNRTAFEDARKITTVVFDKTGTLTKGSHEVQKVLTVSEKFTQNNILQFAAAVEQHSEHYISKGIITYLKEKGLELLQASDFKYLQGIGVSAVVSEKKVSAAGPGYFTKDSKPLPGIPGEIDQETETIIYVIIDDEFSGLITLADSIRETSAAAIKDLHSMGIKSVLLTGDNERIAASVAGKLKMDGYFANVLPHLKQEKISELMKSREVVAMTGDGVNDAPALAQASVGIAVGSGTDVAAETADIILVNNDPLDVVAMIHFARKTYRKMIQNLLWAVGYNIIAIPLAAGILYPHFILSPAMGAVLMSFSTVIVAINARLLSFR